nr:unnamed protein product [Callosobruchus analis]
MQISIFFVFICATAFSRVAAYSEENVVRLIHSVPLEERRDFIKYALECIPKAFSDILRFYRIHNSAPLQLKHSVGEIVCFDWGCIDINDPTMNVHLLIFVVLLVNCIVLAAPSKKDMEFVDNILQNVPAEERRRFIKEQLFAGYLKTESLDYKLADDDAVQLYNIYMKNCPKVTPHSGMLRERICLPNGHCFDPDDSGVYP